ncbi:MAG: AAA family ATPase, partial [Thermodesulfobacteriota bacterium]|nr:AAA family ATPase [Thermodesulfobacteriota bacterium]
MITTPNLHKDNNERFAVEKCAVYLKRYLNRNVGLDKETMQFLCWTLSQEKKQIGECLLEQIDEDERYKIEEEFEESGLDLDDYSDALLRVIRKLNIRRLKKFKHFIFRLLIRKIQLFSQNRKSDIKKNIISLQSMFNLSGQEVEFCTFFFIVNTYEEPESFFNLHLDCNEFKGRNHLKAILAISRNELEKISNGTLLKAGLIEKDYDGLCLSSECITLIQSSSRQVFSKNFYSRIPLNKVSLEHHFVENDKTLHVLNLLKKKPKTSTHILLYGPPGTGKTSFAYALADNLKIPTYEIIRGEKNTTEKRRTSIMACLNTTNSGEGSLILLDEADNILNTRFSWFFRGETQDKGWLNQLLEEPAARMIWITNEIENIEDSVIRRFAFSLHFKPFNRRQRIELWQHIVAGHKVKRFFNQSNIADLAGKYQVSAGVLDLAITKAVETSPRSKTAFLKTVEIALDAYQTVSNHGEKPVNKNKIEKNYSLDGLNIQGDIKAIVDQLEKFDQFLRNADHDKIQNMNLLFYGPPGSGKSELARYIAEKLDREIICKRVSDLQNKYVGESEKNIKRAFADAEAEESILIIDEVDSLLFSRDQAQRSWEISFTNEFLTQMERYRGILICTTNRLKGLDNASIRRFNYK